MYYYFGHWLYRLSLIKHLKAKCLLDGGPWDNILSNGDVICGGLIYVSLAVLDMKNFDSQTCSGVDPLPFYSLFTSEQRHKEINSISHLFVFMAFLSNVRLTVVDQ